MGKVCKHCNIEKELFDFYKHKGICKSCTLVQNKIWKDSNKEKTSNTSKEWYHKTKKQRQKLKAEYYRNKRKIDSLFKLKHNVRAMIHKGLRINGYKKKSKSIEILGCSFEEFKLYLESKFEPWMNWDNHGLYNGTEMFGWDIDHIIPLSSTKTEDDIIKLNHYINLQPLCSKTNRFIKRNILKLG